MRGRKCNKCDAICKESDIVGINIRETEGFNFKFCVERICHSCQWRSITKFDKKESTLEGMCYFILEQIRQKKLAVKSKGRKKRSGPITDLEVKKMLEFIRNSKSHDDLLKQLGVSENKYEDTS